MDMQVGGSNAIASSQSSFTANWQQRQHNFKDLMSALQSGDLSAAQSAYAALTDNSDSSSTSADGANRMNVAGPLGPIGQALQSGDLAGAQKAAQVLAGAHGHHRHHRASGFGEAPAPTSTTLTEGAIGSLVNTAA